ncbi:MAG: tetratricopeptide (TPR) repeat protein [Chlamydiales bacterium]|jgi:tetratricopeptide (TPR) repeat protein
MSQLRRTTLIVLPSIVLAIAGGWWFRNHSGPPPPIPVDLADADPEIASLVRDAVDAVTARLGDTSQRLQLGFVYEANNYFAFAAQCYEQVLERDARQPQAWYRLAICRERDGELDGAIEAMRQVTRFTPDFAPAHLRLSFWLLDTGAVADAAQAIERAGALNPDGRGQRVAEALLKVERGDARAAVALIEGHRLTEGIGGTYAAHLLARAHRMLGQHDAARRAIAAVDGRPASAGPGIEDPWSRQLASLRAGLAPKQRQVSALLRAGKYAEAIEMLETLHLADPEEVRTHIMLAQCFLSTQRPTQALRWVETALSVAPDHFGSNIGFAKIAAQLGGKYEAALERALGCAERAIDIRPTSGDAHDARGNVLFALGRSDDALEEWREAWRLDARSPTSLVRAGQLMIHREEWQAARAIFDEVLEHFEDDALPFICRARTEMELGELDAAERSLASAQALPSANAGAMRGARARLTVLRGKR